MREYLTKLTPYEFLGVLTLLKVAVKNPDGSFRSFDDMVNDAESQFNKLDPKTQKKLRKLINAASTKYKKK